MGANILRFNDIALSVIGNIIDSKTLVMSLSILRICWPKVFEDAHRGRLYVREMTEFNIISELGEECPVGML